MNQIALFEVFAFDPSTCDYDKWMGTATLETARKLGLKADLTYPLYADKRTCADGWGYKAH
jgi:hypothetical protein